MTWILASLAAFAGSPPPCDAVPPPALVVALWDRRDPTLSFLGLRIGAPHGERQVEMREALLDVLYGLDGLVVPGDHVSIVPHGIDDQGSGVEGLRSTRGAPGDLYPRLKVALPNGRDGVRAVHFTVPEADARPVTQGWINDRIVEGLLRPCPTCVDLRERDGDPATARDRAHPSLLTHHALATAYVAHGLDASCAEPDEVYLAWVSPDDDGFGNFPGAESAVRAELGELAVQWGRALQRAYWLEPVRDEGHVQVFRVHRGAAREERGGGGDPVWVDAEGQPAALVRGTTWSGGFDSLPIPDWRAAILPGWTVHSGRAALDGSGEFALEVDGTVVRFARPDALRDAVASGARQRLVGQHLTYDPVLDTQLRLVPPPDPLYGWVPVAILEPRTVASPRIRLSYVPLPWWQIGAAVGGAGLLALAFGQQAWVRTRRRRLEVTLGWTERPEILDLAAFRDQASFGEEFRVRVADGSGYRPRNAALDVRVSLRTFLQPEVPLKSGHEADFQRLDAGGWEGDGDGWRRRLDGPWRGALDAAPLTVTTRHAAIDFARVRRDELTVVHAVRVEVHDRTGRYEDADQTLFVPVRLRSVPGPAEPAMALEVAPGALSRWIEVDLQGLSEEAWAGARRVDVGWLVAENPVRKHYTPLPVTFRALVLAARLVPDGGGDAHMARVRVRDPGGSESITEGWAVDAGERRTGIVQIELPDACRAAATTRWRVTVEVSLTCDDGTPSPPPLSPCSRAFQLRTAGRSRGVVLDFGTGATRVLLQDLDDERWGFLPLEGGGEDLPGAVFRAASGDWYIGSAAWEARREGREGEFLESIKALAAESDAHASSISLRAAVSAVLARALAPTRAGDKPIAALRMGEPVAMAAGERGQVTVLVPNEASAAWCSALIAAVQAVHARPIGVSVLCEAEASALWYASVLYGAPPPALPDPPPHMRLLVIDVGAGTTDAALVALDRSPGRSSVQLVATGGAGAAGRVLDAAIYDAVASAWRSPRTFRDLAAAEQETLRPTLEAAKVALSEGHLDAKVEIFTAGARWSTPLSVVSGAEAWGRALDRVAREPLTVLCGRLGGGDAPLAGVELVVLTGRGAQAWGMVDRVERAVTDLGVPPGRVHRVPGPFLKAAVSLGGRLYATGLCGDFSPADQTLRERIIAVYRRPFGRVHAVELVPAGRPFRGGPVVGEWIDLPRFEQARLVRTWMIPVERDRRSPWEIDGRGLVALLQGEPIERMRGMPEGVAPYRAIPWDAASLRFDRGELGDPSARVRARVWPDGRVEIESWSGP